jgi:hypothetical protein
MDYIQHLVLMLAAIVMSPATTPVQITQGASEGLSGVSAPGGCPVSQTAGCDKGVWAIGRMRAALIAALERPATYKICINPGSQGAVTFHVNGIPLVEPYTSSTPALVPPINVDEAVNRACALITGATIAILPSVLPGGSPASGTYERVEESNPLTRLYAFNLQSRPMRDLSAALVHNTDQSLYRVCIAPLTQPSGEPVGQRHIATEKGFLLAVPENPRGIALANGNCVDIEAAQIYLFGAHPDVDERINGFVAY